jgi:hypothetical protein
VCAHSFVASAQQARILLHCDADGYNAQLNWPKMHMLLSRHRMMLARRLLFGVVMMLIAQASSYSQTSATVSGNEAETTAGQSFTLHLTFDKAATCEHYIQVMLGKVDSSEGISLGGVLATGKDAADATGDIPKDFYGQFVSNSTTYGKPTLRPCAGYSASKVLDMPTVTLNVKAIPDPNSYPTAARVELSLTQEQFLDTKVAQLSNLTSKIDTRVDDDGRDTRQLRDFLADIITKAEADLTTTEKEFQRLILKKDESLPPFFNDFHRKYAHLRTELDAPIPGERAGLTVSAHLVYVQQTLQRRPSDSSPGRSGNRSGSTPNVANGTKALIEDNASAYKIVKVQGSQPKFHATFESIPDQATLYYRPEFEPNFETYSKPTNIGGADFPLGWYVFKFHRDDCQDEPVRTINANEDTNPDVSVEFAKCKKR